MQNSVRSKFKQVCTVMLTVMLLPLVMLVISPSRGQLRRLAVLPLQPLEAVAAVCGGHGADGVLHLPDLDLGLALDPGLLWPPRHRARLRGQVDRRGLVSLDCPGPGLAPRLTSAHLRASAGGLSLQTRVSLLSRLAALFTQREQLLNCVRTGGS